jgi:histidine kinase
VSVGKIDVSALSKEDVGRLVSDTVLHNVEATRELTQSIYDKTQGNPFFVSEMLGALHRSGAIWFERDELSWQWSMEKVNSSAITDNVVELMTSKLAVLPEASQNLLKIAACVGATFDLRTLSIVSETIGTEVAEKLWLAVEAGMLTPIGEAYKFVKEENQTTEELSSNLSQVKYQFVHDRVQQAAYGLLALDEKEKMHWRVGNLLLAELSQDEMTEKLFDVVGHLNAGKNLATSEMERERLAQLNCDAGKRALSATAFEAAVQYLQKAEELLPSEEWVVAYSITKEVKTELARALMLSAQHEALEIVIQELLSNLRTALERSEVYTIHLRALVMEGKSQECINVGAVALRELGLRFPTKGSLPLALKEVLHTRWVLRNWNENVSMVKISDDLTHRAILNILLRIGEATFIAQPLLIAAVAGTVVRLSLRKGLTSVSPFGFAFFSVLVVTVLQDIKLGERLVIFAEALIQLRELQNASVKGITIFISNMFLWTFRNPTLIVASTLLENTAFLRSVGELSNMANCSSSMLGSYFEISSVNHCMEISTPWQIRIKHAGLENTSASNWLNSMFQSCLSLANTHNQSLLQSEEKSLWSDTHLNRDELIASASRRKDISSIASIYIGEVITEYMSGKIKIALKTAELIKPNREGVQGLNSELYYVYYATLACTAAARGEAGAEEQKKRSKHLRAAKSHLSWLKKRAEWAPMNFLQKYEILQAELLDANGKQVEAAEWYGYSIANADKNGNLSDAGLTRELFGGSLWRAGKRAEATRILKASCKAYTVWGALAVIRKIENKYPDIFAEQIAARKKLELEKSQTKDNTKTASDTLDIQAVMKASQTISGEIELEKLLTKLMTVAMESSGADKAALALWETDIPYIQAESVVNGDTRILQSLRLDECQTLPTSILLSVGRLQKAIVLGNASKSTEFANDVYVKEKQVQSVLCLPIVNQSKLVGVLYVENSLTTDAFTLDRVQLLTMLSSQAAISIDNAKLYSNVQAVTAEKSRIQTEMDVAQKIQTALLPEKPNLKGYEAFGYMKTADEVGGDYYDTIQSGNRQFAVIGDVSGHGVTSGLVMMMAQTILHTIINANGTESTAEILSRANVTLTKNIVKLKESKYMTMTLLEMKENGHVRYAGAHLDSIVYRHNTNQIDILPSSGFWLGMEDDISAYMVEQKASLNNGDILLLFTDGVTEAIGTDKKLFGSDRLGEVLKDNASLSLETIKDSILKSLASFETPDDVTLLVIRKMDGD